MKTILIFLISLTSSLIYSQQIYTFKDIDTYNSVIAFSEQSHLSDSGLESIIVNVGKQFLGTLYVGGVLDAPENENLVIDLSRLDCVTFVENVLALSLSIKSGKTDFKDFCRELQYLRYRNGVMNGYSSRLHYFYDWISNNEEKGILKNITKETGGQRLDKKIDAMSVHYENNPHLKNDSTLNSIVKAESELTSMDKYYIPKNKIKEAEAIMHDGDLVAFTTSADGMEVAHVGIAVHVKGRVHLMHASSLNKMVEISKIPLAEMLGKRASYTGVIIARIV